MRVAERRKEDEKQEVKETVRARKEADTAWFANELERLAKRQAEAVQLDADQHQQAVGLCDYVGSSVDDHWIFDDDYVDNNNGNNNGNNNYNNFQYYNDNNGDGNNNGNYNNKDWLICQSWLLRREIIQIVRPTISLLDHPSVVRPDGR